MSVVVSLASVLLIVIVLIDGFETAVLPRRVSRRFFRPARTFYLASWAVCRALACWLSSGKRRSYVLALFGPLSMLFLLACWAAGLIVGFGLLHWGLATPLNPSDVSPDLFSYCYLSGVTFFTLGYGDLTAREPLGRILTVLECGVGYGFLAVVIGYVPVLYNVFARRETTIALLDARAGSPPTAAEVLLRMGRSRHAGALTPLLAEWERWAAELLESHISFPVLCYYRCQHDNQSWLAAIVAVLDTCALLIVGIHDGDPYQARLTFAVSRHALVDLCLAFNTAPIAPQPDRLPPERLEQLRQLLAEVGLTPARGEAVDERLTELRAMYEPFANALARYFLFDLPPVLSDKPPIDNWQTSAWTRRVAGISRLSLHDGDDHLD